MESNYTKLIATLRECFMLDQADLDFGIYRIMNSRRTEIETFLEKDLIPQVKTILASAGNADKGSLERELTEAINSAKTLGADPESLPKVREIRAKLLDTNDLTALENEVFSHLTNFIRRYFDCGDFISMRRYKKDVYAIPYEGEEVKLHWANADQYYIKTSEYFKKYRFKINEEKAIVFTLVEASTEQNNNKTQGDKERKFKLYTPDKKAAEDGKPTESLEVVDGELHIYFTYEPMEKGIKQDTLISEAFEKIKSKIPAEFKDGISLSPTAKNKNRTLLEKHLVDYVAKNTFDYFIHKDLYGFLTRELDFYIKNEILYIDDIDSRSPESFIGSFAMIKAVKQIGEKIITFLAQLEEFQKKLFLKKKMVVETGYCITLDRIDEKFYDDIRVNEAQINDWVSLFAIDEIKGFTRPLTKEFLKENPFLVLDTKHFPESWKNKLIGEIENLDESLDGLMINSENFQALNLLQERYREQVKCIYIDPPYNTGGDGFIYKDSYKSSTWISMMHDRMNLHGLISNQGLFFSHIDENEFGNLNKLSEHFFETKKEIIWKKISDSDKTKGKNVQDIKKIHEYILFGYQNKIIFNKAIEGKGIENGNLKKSQWFNTIEEIKVGSSKWGDEFFGIKMPGGIKIPYKLLEKDKIEFIESNSPGNRWPIIRCQDGIIYISRWDCDSLENGIIGNKDTQNIPRITVKGDINMPSILEAFGNMEEAKSDLFEQFGSNIEESVLNKLTPKPVQLSKVIIKAGTNPGDIILDYFAGSGTTGHAVINLNREDGKDGGEMGRRKYMLVEMGEYFDTVTKPRIQKVIYSEDWKGGKPVSRKGSSHAFKYLRLESYEDALNNLKLQRSETQQGVLFAPENAEFREDYMLQYMLDTESQGSILSVDHFAHPFDFEMRITRDNETRVTRVDLVETFNYLIGLVVEHTYEARGYRVVKGCTLEGEKILIVWRDIAKHSNEDLENFLKKSTYNPLDTEFDRIYVNGDNTLENMKTGEQTWKVTLIEEEFKKRMFDL